MERCTESVRYESQIGICVCVYDVYFKHYVNTCDDKLENIIRQLMYIFELQMFMLSAKFRAAPSYQSLISDKFATHIYNLPVTPNTIVRLCNISNAV